MAKPQGVSFADTTNEVFVASPDWTRLDQDYKVVGWTIDRGRSYELDRVGTGRATVDLIDTTSHFDPVIGSDLDVLCHMAICLRNPVTSAWSTLFRGYVSSITWTPHITEGFAFVHVELVDAMAIFAAAEMVPDGNWGEDVVNGNIVFNEDTATTAVRTRINLVLDQIGWPANTTAADGVTNGTTTFTSASASFPASIVGQYINIFGKGRFEIVARTNATTITLSGSPSSGTSLAYTYGMRNIFSGNVKLLGDLATGAGVYAPRTTALAPILDAADAEFPTVANFYVDKNGVPTFHGRLARFDPTNPDYNINTWYVGNRDAVESSPSTVAPLSPPLSFSRDDENFYTSAIATPQGIADADIPGQYVTDSRIDDFGSRTWSAENLLTGGGADDATALEVTKLFADYIIDNYAEVRTRVGQVTVKGQAPSGISGAATWALLCGVDISDVLNITTNHDGSAFSDDFFVEGIHYVCKPMNANHPEVELTMDVSPTGYYDADPFS